MLFCCLFRIDCPIDCPLHGSHLVFRIDLRTVFFCLESEWSHWWSLGVSYWCFLTNFLLSDFSYRFSYWVVRVDLFVLIVPYVVINRIEFVFSFVCVYQIDIFVFILSTWGFLHFFVSIFPYRFSFWLVCSMFSVSVLCIGCHADFRNYWCWIVCSYWFFATISRIDFRVYFPEQHFPYLGFRFDCSYLLS